MYKRNWEDYIPDVKRWFYNDDGIQMFGTYWYGFEGIFTAGHVLTEAGMRTPEGTPSFRQWDHRIGGLDISTNGFDYKCPVTYPVYENQEIIVLGYPAGSRNLESRKGWVHMEREEGVWIGAIQDPAEPVVVGMSGGMVLGKQKNSGDWKPIGVLIHRNSPANLKNGVEYESCDFVSIDYIFNNKEMFRSQQRIV